MSENSGLQTGFTFLELLVVIGIIGVLAQIVIVGIPSAQQRAKDSQRRSDLKQYQIALETYANNYNGRYPMIFLRQPDPSRLCGPGRPLSWLSNCPKDPDDGQLACGGDGTNECHYRYISDGSSYILWTILRRPPSNSYPIFVVCSNGTTAMAAFPEPSEPLPCPPVTPD